MASMVRSLCGSDQTKQAEVRMIAEQALEARPHFWNGIYDALH
ncbi:MAG: DUF3050 domain-containing protein [Gammaproteobacteria bacterium]|nr:MAG: DUF3050 domain-containing protein [Gammaproteobacteria bacterium]